LAPEFASPWYNLGALYFRRGNIAKAREAAQRLRALEPELAEQLLQQIGR